ncbi:MAG TPA: TraR/DksA family transcriptional regulator [Rhodanobacteraceae bacterium]|jgi:RNA polymerase-binding transcription factor DksA|nr:TraR/DksA family transcriptional regulator [Rhodanobacteraceae bacterium]
MPTLTPEQIRYLSSLMDARFDREIREIRSVGERMRDERDEGVPADWVDVALANATLASDDAVVNQDVADVRDIIAARERLSAGTYGTCTDCGEAIAYERLLAYPTAKRCIHCQRLYEQGKAVGRTLRAS